MSEEIVTQPPIKITWLVATLAALALFVIIGAYSSRMTWDYSGYDQQRAADRKANLVAVQKAENTLIYPAADAQGQAHAEWIDQGKGLVRLPIDEAMNREVDLLKNQPAAAGCAIDAAAPASPPASAGTNAAPAQPSTPVATSSTAAGATNVAPSSPNPPSAKLKKANK